ncbi:MAG: thiamine phosphate synthase [Bryobacterales bacterium]|nr:thiamine phosphate synthase [Bryobacterales bacterium]
MTPALPTHPPLMLPRVYPIVDTATLAPRRLTPLDAARAMIDGGARILQLRHKEAFNREVFEEARRVAALCEQAGVLFVLNDRADLARLLSAGLHIGQEDQVPSEAREVLGAALSLGYSTHNLKQLREASSEPVDYLAIGPVFGTINKQNPDPMVGLEALRQIAACSVRPLVAIGGVTLENAQRLYDAGIHCAAIIGDLYALGDTAPDIQRRVAQWNDLYPHTQQ